MESYTYLFLFVLQLVFTVVVLLALLHEKRLQKQLEKKNKQTNTCPDIDKYDRIHRC